SPPLSLLSPEGELSYEAESLSPEVASRAFRGWEVSVAAPIASPGQRRRKPNAHWPRTPELGGGFASRSQPFLLSPSDTLVSQPEEVRSKPSAEPRQSKASESGQRAVTSRQERPTQRL
ncbi:unnamed protein product, partial [Effrenium voratum]